jgi:fatty acid desaturase
MHPLAAHLSEAQIDAFGAALDAIRARVLDDRGARDAAYIRKITRVQRALALSGRALIFAWAFPPAWALGVAALGVAKILDNMEIGHNVLHGQYDFLKDPALDSRTYEWDTACPSDQWRHSHNYVHHTFTNVLGKDRDVGYGILRMADEQPWRPEHLTNPLRALMLALFFQWGVAFHDLETERIAAGEKPWRDAIPLARGIARKARGQLLKDYVLFPLLGLPVFVPVLLGNAIANLMRNVWAFTIIFCGHFPAGVAVFEPERLEEESRGRWYVRQLLGSANLEGGPLFHVMSGNLSHQIEHHLFPDLPAHRYAEIAPEVRALAAEYGLPYQSGSLARQFGSVVGRIFALALPPRASVART